MVTFVVYLSLLLWYFYWKVLDDRLHCRSLLSSNAVLARACPCATIFLSGEPNTPKAVRRREECHVICEQRQLCYSKQDGLLCGKQVGIVRRRIAIEISPATRTAVKRQEGERRWETKQLYPNQTTYPRSLFRDIFHWREVNPIDDLSLLYRVPKASIWLKLSPPIFFQLFIWKRFTLVFLPYI